MKHISDLKKSSPKHLWLILALAMVTTMGMFPSTASAQKIVVPTFKSRGAGKLAYKARMQMLRSLRQQGVQLVPYKRYLYHAKQLRLRRVAFRPKAIGRIANAMGLDGVVTGRAWRQGKRFKLSIMAYNASGELITSKTYRFRWQAFPAGSAKMLSKAIVSQMGVSEPVDDFNVQEPEPVVEAPAATEPVIPSGTPDDAMPAWSRTPDQSTASRSQQLQEPITPPTAVASRTSRSRRSIGSVPDILLSAGMSGNLRSGLKPIHESSIYPGLRVDARIFLRSITDSSVIGNFALGGMLNNGFALKYGLEGEEEEWSSSMRQWQAELTYRFKFDDVSMQPAFLLRAGYGSTINTIDTDNEAAISAGYSYPYSGLDIYITLWKPYLRFFAGGSFIYPVSLSKDIEGTAWGLNARGGFDMLLFGNLHAGIGYEMWHFRKLLFEGEEVSDTFQSFFFRMGWSYQ